MPLIDTKTTLTYTFRPSARIGVDGKWYPVVTSLLDDSPYQQTIYLLLTFESQQDALATANELAKSQAKSGEIATRKALKNIAERLSNVRHP